MPFRASLLPLLVAVTTFAFAPSAQAQTAAPATPPKKDAPAKRDEPKKTDGGRAAAAAPTPGPAAPVPATDAKPADAEKEEKEEHRAVYLSADLGFTRADLGGFSDNTDFDKTSANGFLAGLGIGYRYKDLRIGGRFRSTDTTEYTLWSLMGEVGYGLPFRPVSPTIFIHGGYVFDVGVERAVIGSSLPRGNVVTPDVNLDGVVIGGELVASYWLTKFARVGPFIGFDATILSRGQVPLPTSIFPITNETRQNPLYSDSGGGLGYLLSVGIRGTGDISF